MPFHPEYFLNDFSIATNIDRYRQDFDASIRIAHALLSEQDRIVDT